jgi:hypothetical protein
MYRANVSSPYLFVLKVQFTVLATFFLLLVLGPGCWVLACPPQTIEKFASTQHLEPSP